MGKLGDNIKMIRIAAGMSQQEFAEKMNTNQQHISGWERGVVEPSLYNILKIIKVLDTSFEELTDGIEID